MPDKLTDKEIVKALEWCVSKFKNAGFVYMGVDGTKLVRTQEVLDLINRLQADYDRLQKSYLRNQEIFAEQSLENERLKAENERLKNNPTLPKSGFINLLCDALIYTETLEQYNKFRRTLKAEIYKECIGKATNKILPMLTTATLEDKETICFCLNALDNLLKENGGLNNE